MKAYLEAGRLVSVHGVRGELKAEIWCDDYDFFAEFDRFFLDEQGSRALQVTGCRPQKNMALVRFAGFDTPEQSRALVGRTLYFPRSAIQLEEGRCFIADLLGCRVIDAATGLEYGIVTDIRPGAQDLYTVRAADGKLYYFPAVPEFLHKLQPEQGTILVTPIPGLFGDAVNGDEE